MANQPPTLYYAFSKDFDYRRYLEKRTHFDRVELAVDTGLRRLLASDSELSARHITAVSDSSARVIAGIREAAASTSKGFDKLEFALLYTRASINELRSVCEYGFGEINLCLTSIGISLEELVKATKTPTQTWAWEQFTIGQDAFRKHLFEESLVYVNKAIDGDKSNSGYPLEHRFYLLQGLLRLGDFKNAGQDIVDLPKALESFLIAARYAEHVDKLDYARSYGLAGWTAYCCGDMRAAEKHLRRSLAVNSSDTQSRFDLSKLLLHQGHIEEGIQHFMRALRADFGHGLRAAADPDFLSHKASLVSAIEQYRKELTQKLGEYVSKFASLVTRERRDVLSRHQLSFDAAAIAFFERLGVNLSTLPAADLDAALKAAPNYYSDLQQSLENAKNTLLALSRQKSAQANADRRSVTEFSEGMGKPVYMFAVAGAVMGVGLTALSIWEEVGRDILGILLFPVMLTIFGGIIGAIGYFGGGIVGFIVVSIHRIFAHAKEKSVASDKAKASEGLATQFESDALKL